MRIISRSFFASIALLAAAPAVTEACDSTVDIVLASSGGPGSGFDNFDKDFDILRELVLLAELDGALGNPDADGLSDITVFAPWDDGENFYRYVHAFRAVDFDTFDKLRNHIILFLTLFSCFTVRYPQPSFVSPSP